MLLLIFLAIAVTALAPFIGIEFISPGQIVRGSLHWEIFFGLRVPRVCTAFCAGAGLSLCGMVFQALFRNPLADPFTLGVASGASCGAALTVIIGCTGAIAGIPVVTIGAFLGSCVATLFLFAFAVMKRSIDRLTMLLAGVAMSFIFSSMLMFFQYLSDVHDSFYIIRWLMGGIESSGYRPLLTMLPFVLLSTAVIYFHVSFLDHLLTGDDIAKSRGIDITRLRTVLLAATALMVGAIVAVCGPIGFVGLVVPHISRSLFSWRHTLSLPATLLGGGLLMVVADMAGRTVVAPAEMPAGVITALLGAPFFLWILFRNSSRGMQNDL
jgi:iron complex transport system permease protein